MAAVLDQAAAAAHPATANGSLVRKIAERFGVDAAKLLGTLKATAFRQATDREITNEEMMALLIIADQYKLNPFTRELFAFFDKKSNAIVPVVSVDGWARIINEHPQLDGIEFVYSDETIQHKGKVVYVWMECVIRRKDRSEPIRVREFFDEVVREVNFTTPWDTHPKRMHRHKTLIQCARLAFGFAGIYDEDEAMRIVEGQAVVRDVPSEAIDKLNARIENNPSPTVPTPAPQAAEPVPAPATAQVTTPTPPPGPNAVDAGAVPAGAGSSDDEAVRMKLADFKASIAEASDSDDLNQRYAAAKAWAADKSEAVRQALIFAYDAAAAKFAPQAKRKGK